MHKEEEEPQIALDQGFLMMIYVESAGNWKLAKSEAGSTGWDQTVELCVPRSRLYP